ncbi:MAG: phenylalanine--tRNA ligase subunit beta [Castellaniella sp.]|uniref:phenylalanine--tRNA ligase subunit beta n=1 Tax=Castellaniella sp. TaxID=1955812 RepID=UPI002A35BB64|nr:phenylalanine--tRNA ligase subunit beta [Castellaniella sp.]MDY0308910.1 phenylalanine--tRNA ligase subunit beta [Castellaniella sp.]
MQFPESWLRAWADPDIDSQELAHRLTMAGLEVEDADPYAPPFSGVVVARIETLAPHPNADKLRVCQVDDGSGQPVQIVCGAPNAAAGLVVPLAQIGAELPGGLRIGPVKMRGVESRGMLCSARELGLSQDHAGLLELPADLTPGQDLRQALNLDDTIYTLKLTPNRADCLSIQGVAREVSALTGCALRIPDTRPVPVTIQDRLPVTVQAPDLCGRFAGRIVRGVNARAQTPAWIRSRLERAGQRPVSALVDISNYVMLELGRPTHVFDLARIKDGLTVRWARDGEQLQLLNDQTVELTSDVGVIAAGESLESLAGIMGGQASAVTLDTTDVYLEAAFWWPEAIMGRSRRYKLHSEAGHRFERGVDFSTIPDHLDRMTALILDICGGQAGPLDDQIVNLPAREPVRMRLARCARVLGIPLDAAAVSAVFTRLGLVFEQQGDDFVVTPPAARFDLTIEEDLIEEVARIHGFDRIPDRPPVAAAVMRSVPETLYGPHALRAALVARDYQEVINFSFVEEAWERDYCGNTDPIRLLNPIASQLAVMRSSLIGGLLANIAHNAKHRQTRVRVFELGRVFARDASVADGGLAVAGVAQPTHLAAAAWGPVVAEQWGEAVRQVDFFDVKRDLEALLGARVRSLRCEAATHPALHPGRSARLWLDDRAIGWLGEIHPRWTQALDLPHAPVVFELDAEAVSERVFPHPQEQSRQPVVVRDLAIWVDADVPWQSLLDTLQQRIAADDALSVLKDIKLFDIWRDAATPRQRSLGLRLWLQGHDATLEDRQVDHCVQRLLDALAETHGARLRS